MSSGPWCEVMGKLPNKHVLICVLSGFTAGETHATETPGGTGTRSRAAWGRATGWYHFTTTAVWPEAQPGIFLITITMPWCAFVFHGCVRCFCNISHLHFGNAVCKPTLISVKLNAPPFYFAVTLAQGRDRRREESERLTQLSSHNQKLVEQLAEVMNPQVSNVFFW